MDLSLHVCRLRPINSISFVLSFGYLKIVIFWIDFFFFEIHNHPLSRHLRLIFPFHIYLVSFIMITSWVFFWCFTYCYKFICNNIWDCVLSKWLKNILVLKVVTTSSREIYLHKIYKIYNLNYKRKCVKNKGRFV